jgi:hypothetical protein
MAGRPAAIIAAASPGVAARPLHRAAGVHAGGDGDTKEAGEGVASAVAGVDGVGDSTGADGDPDPVGVLLTTGAVPQAVKIKSDPARAEMARRMLV